MRVNFGFSSSSSLEIGEKESYGPLMVHHPVSHNRFKTGSSPICHNSD